MKATSVDTTGYDAVQSSGRSVTDFEPRVRVDARQVLWWFGFVVVSPAMSAVSSMWRSFLSFAVFICLSVCPNVINQGRRRECLIQRCCQLLNKSSVGCRWTNINVKLWWNDTGRERWKYSEKRCQSVTVSFLPITNPIWMGKRRSSGWISVKLLCTRHDCIRTVDHP
jgi:hypothetical protein